MGLSAAEGIAVAQSLKPAMLFKRMTTNASSQVWQDVYHAPCPGQDSHYPVCGECEFDAGEGKCYSAAIAEQTRAALREKSADVLHSA
ncbi:MAG: type II toxin-antitoxin system MqsR family toxin [Zoogloeaceae bacterium]|jgi:motility quorum-sensing regulator/GCU-specific mRNA interferase toxin|nr:type II toxin-antitoxin system MqsR family toxin [Zoogloeaceae bacterium]